MGMRVRLLAFTLHGDARFMPTCENLQELILSAYKDEVRDGKVEE
jgi:hypothetical protein